MIQYVKDSFALLDRIRPKTFDHIITDPPFAENVQSNMMSGTTLEKVDLEFAHVESYAFTRTLRDIARRWIVMFCAVEDFGLVRTEVNEKPRRKSDPAYEHRSFARGCIWYKPNSMGQITADRPAAACEGIAVYHGLGEPWRWNGKGSYGFYATNGTRGEPDRHPNQKPLDLCLRLVASFTDRGDTVFDPFAGSGRIGEACRMLGRGYLGFDFDQNWVAEGNRRIDANPWQIDDAKALTLCSARKDEL